MESDSPVAKKSKTDGKPRQQASEAPSGNAALGTTTREQQVGGSSPVLSLHKLSSSEQVAMFFENEWSVELADGVASYHHALRIIREGITGDILFSFDTKQELIDNLKEGGISHFPAIAMANQVSLLKANIFQKLKSEVDRHKIVEFIPLPHEGTPRIVKPPHDIDQSLNSPVVDRSNEVDFVLRTIVADDYLERPVLFQCLNMSGMGKTFFGLRLADQLFQRCQPLSQPAEDWKSKLAVIDKEILSEFDENTSNVRKGFQDSWSNESRIRSRSPCMSSC